jgi:hypothetical protein
MEDMSATPELAWPWLNTPKAAPFPKSGEKAAKEKGDAAAPPLPVLLSRSVS